jgi:hypothetical protein
MVFSFLLGRRKMGWSAFPNDAAAVPEDLPQPLYACLYCTFEMFAPAHGVPWKEILQRVLAPNTTNKIFAEMRVEPGKSSA